MNELVDSELILSPDDPALVLLCNALRDLSSQLDNPTTSGEIPWPRKQLELCGKYGVFKWFIDEEHGAYFQDVDTKETVWELPEDGDVVVDDNELQHNPMK